MILWHMVKKTVVKQDASPVEEAGIEQIIAGIQKSRKRGRTNGRI